MCGDGRFLVTDQAHPLRIAGGTIPKGLPVKNIRSSSNRIESDADGVNQQTVLRVILDPSHNLAVQKVFPYQPPRAAQRCHDDVNLAHASQAMMRTRKGSVVIPRWPVFRAILFNRDLTHWSKIPLRTVGRIPQTSLQATPPVSLSLGKFELLPLRIILNLNEAGQCSLDRVPDVSEPIGIAVIPTRMCPLGKGLHVVAPIVIKRNSIFRYDPIEIGVHNIGLLDHKEGG